MQATLTHCITGIIFKLCSDEQSRWWGDGVTFILPPGSFFRRMHTIIRCRLIGDRWERLERIHLPFGFDSEAAATAYAENLNRQRWPSFDWIKEPTEAFLAFRD